MSAVRQIAIRREWDPLFDPALSSGLIIDVCPDYGSTIGFSSGARIASIKDRINGNVFSQATSTQQPQVIRSDANFGGRASILWDQSGGAAEELLCASVSGLASTGKLTIAWVERPTALAGGSSHVPISVGPYGAGSTLSSVTPFWYGADSKMYSREVAANGAITQASSTSAGTINATYRTAITADISATPSVTQVFRNGSSAGSAASNGAGNASSFTSSDWTLGSAGSVAGFNYTGYVSRWLVWNRILSGTEIATLDTGLRSFFSL